MAYHKIQILRRIFLLLEKKNIFISVNEYYRDPESIRERESVCVCVCVMSRKTSNGYQDEDDDFFVVSIELCLLL
jgi:hypothetical protein